MPPSRSGRGAPPLGSAQSLANSPSGKDLFPQSPPNRPSHLPRTPRKSLGRTRLPSTHIHRHPTIPHRRCPPRRNLPAGGQNKQFRPATSPPISPTRRDPPANHPPPPPPHPNNQTTTP